MLCTKCGNKRASGAICKKCGSPLLTRLSDEIPSDQDIELSEKESKKKEKKKDVDEQLQVQSIKPEVLSSDNSFLDSSVSVPTDFKFSDDSDPLLDEENPMDSVNALTAKPVHQARRVPRRKPAKTSKRQIKQIILRIVITLFIAIAVYYIINAIFSPGFFIFGF